MHKIIKYQNPAGGIGSFLEYTYGSPNPTVAKNPFPNFNIPKIETIPVTLQVPEVKPINMDIKPLDINPSLSKRAKRIAARQQRREDGTTANRAGTAGSAMSMAGGMLQAIGGAPDYSGEYGNMTSNMDMGYDAARTVASKMGPWGQFAAGMMDINKGLGGFFGETDKTNKLDAAIDSAFTPFFIKWINSATARKLKSGLSFQQDEKVKSYLADGYGNYDKLVGSKVGGFARDFYGTQQHRLNLNSKILSGLADSAEVSKKVRATDMVSINDQNYSDLIRGVENPILTGKSGMKLKKLTRYKNIINKANYYKNDVQLEEIDSYKNENETCETSSGEVFVNPDKELEIFKQGGQMNVIPEGALHARKNNMELAKEGEITHKGIPVVDKEGGQVAEVEKEEITFTKPVTEKLEDWYKKFYSEDISDKEKDELAIKCGKFITKEILFNTDDRVGLIEKIKEQEGL